jgi:hypothetical protein
MYIVKQKITKIKCFRMNNKPGMVVHAYNPNTWEAEAGGLRSSRTQSGQKS